MCSNCARSSAGSAQLAAAGDMTSTECYDLIKKGVDIEVPGLEAYYDKVVVELRGSLWFCICYQCSAVTL